MFINIDLKIRVRQTEYDFSAEPATFDVTIQDIDLVNAIDLNAIKNKLALRALSLHEQRMDKEVNEDE